MRKLFCILGTVSCFVFNPAQADWVAGEINKFYLHSGYEGIFVIRGSVINPEECPTTDMYYLSQNNAHFDRIYPLLLAAKMSKQTVRLFINGCDASTGRPAVEHVQL